MKKYIYIAVLLSISLASECDAAKFIDLVKNKDLRSWVLVSGSCIGANALWSNAAGEEDSQEDKKDYFHAKKGSLYTAAVFAIKPTLFFINIPIQLMVYAISYEKNKKSLQELISNKKF